MTDTMEVMRRLVNDKRLFMENLLWLEDKDRRAMQFDLNDIQNLAFQYISKPGAREVILKPSQVGMSTLIIGFIFADTITVPGTTSVIIAHEEFITQRLLRKAHFFYDNLPKEFRPDISHRSSNEMLFPQINSVLYIGSARAYVFGRGDAIHNLLADEYAFWPDPERIMVPSMQRVPKNGRIIVNSTPNGEDNAYYDIYQAAKKGNAGWHANFYPWYLHKEYSDGDPKEVITDLDEEERALIELKGLNYGQIRWRRRKVAELEALSRDGTSKTYFKQEFPEDDVSCFLVSGDMVYDIVTLNKLGEKCYPAPYGFEGLQVWHKPEEGVNYYLTTDPGQGKQTQTAASVLYTYIDEDGVERTRHCARYAGWDTPDLFHKRLITWGRYYNNATIIPEANSQGLAVIAGLQSDAYGNLWRRRDPFSGRMSMDIGWVTSVRTKPYMISELARMLPTLETSDIEVIKQLRNIRIKDRNYINIGLDDVHDTMAIFAACKITANPAKGFAGVSGWQNW
jgi:hypothetical protein